MSTVQMHMRTIPRKYNHKTKFNIANNEAHNLLRIFNNQSKNKFQFPIDENCYTLSNQPIQNSNFKQKIKILPLTQELQLKRNQHFLTNSSATDRKSKDQLQPILKGSMTERGNFHIRKITYSTKSTANESQTKTLSGPSKQQNQDWQSGQNSGNQLKLGVSNLTRASRTTIKRKNTQKCLIAVSKKLPFSLQKNELKSRKSKKKIHENKQQTQNSQQNSLFQLQLSKILQKRQQNELIENPSMQDLNVLSYL